MATASPYNRGYTGGIAARAAMPVGGGGPSPMNRGYSGGLAAGSAPGGGFRPSFPGSYGAGMQPARPASPGLSPQQQVINDINKPLDLSTPFSPAPSPSQMGRDAFGLMTGAGTQAQQQERQNMKQAGQQAFNLMGGAPFDPAASLPPFGGFRAEGGPVMPGQAYVVGERGPELIVPQQPATVVPDLQLSPGAQAYLQRQQAPKIDRYQEKRGALKLGLQDDAFNGASPGELVGEYIDPNNGSRIAQNPLNRRYAESRGGDMDSLANRAVRQVGRSNYDVNRIAERAYRQQKNPRLLMALQQQKAQQDFWQQRDLQNFQQQQQMAQMDWQRQQQAATQRQQYEQQMQAARDAAQWQQTMILRGLETGEKAMEAERKRQLEEQQRRDQSADQIIMVPTPDGKGSVPMIVEKGGNRRPIGGYIPNQAPEVPSYVKDPVTGQMVPTGPEANRRPILQPQENEGWSVRGVPKNSYVPYEPNAKPAVPTTRTFRDENGMSYTAQWDPQTGQWIRVQTAPPPAAPTAPGKQSAGYAPIKTPKNGYEVQVIQ